VVWKKFRPISLFALSLLAAHAIATAVLPEGSYPLIVIGSAFPILCGALIIIPSWINWRAAKGAVRIFWLLLAASFTIQLLSQLYFGYFEVILRKDVSGPWGDCLFFLLAVPMLAALSICPHSERVSSRLRFRYLDLLILLLWWLCLYSYFALPWSLAIDDIARFSSVNNALLMVEDSVVLSILAFYGWKTRGTWKRFYTQFFAAFLFFAAGGYLQNFASTLNLYHSGGWFDFPLNIGFVWFVILTENAGALTPEPDQSVQKRSSPGLWSARLTMLAMLSLPVLAAVGSLSSSVPAAVTDFRLRLICIAIVVLGLVVFVRLHLSAREISRLVKMTQSSVRELKSVQARIVQSQKMVALGRLAAGATHEINNPLTAVMGYAELLHEDSSLSAEEARSANKIKEEVRRAQSAILRFRQVAATVEAETNPNASAKGIG
jgi:signal transduction histidine kinase